MKATFKIIITLLTFVSLFSCNKKLKEPSVDDYKVNISLDNWAQMQSDAISKDKNIFLMLHASWCSTCNTFKNDVLTKEDVGAIVNNKIVLGLIDGDKDYGKPYMTQFNATGFPTMIILDKNSNVLLQKTGGMTQSEFLAWIGPYLK